MLMERRVASIRKKVDNGTCFSSVTLIRPYKQTKMMSSSSFNPCKLISNIRQIRPVICNLKESCISLLFIIVFMSTITLILVVCEEVFILFIRSIL